MISSGGKNEIKNYKISKYDFIEELIIEVIKDIGVICLSDTK